MANIKLNRLLKNRQQRRTKYLVQSRNTTYYVKSAETHLYGKDVNIQKHIDKLDFAVDVVQISRDRSIVSTNTIIELYAGSIMRKDA